MWLAPVRRVNRLPAPSNPATAPVRPPPPSTPSPPRGSEPPPGQPAGAPSAPGTCLLNRQVSTPCARTGRMRNYHGVGYAIAIAQVIMKIGLLMKSFKAGQRAGRNPAHPGSHKLLLRHQTRPLPCLVLRHQPPPTIGNRAPVFNLMDPAPFNLGLGAACPRSQPTVRHPMLTWATGLGTINAARTSFVESANPALGLEASRMCLRIRRR